MDGTDGEVKKDDIGTDSEQRQVIPDPSKEFEDEVADCGSTYKLCEFCGRTHFGSLSPGMYEEGELENLQKKAAEEPDLYLEYPDCDSISWGTLDNRQVVIGCPCNAMTKYERFIWNHRYMIAGYLKARSNKEKEMAEMQQNDIGSLEV